MKTRLIEPGSVIGILGGGQLGRMMALAAKQMGYYIAVLEPAGNSSCGQIADYEFTAPYNDREAAKKISSLADIITYEFENIDSDTAAWLADNAYLPQGSRLLSISQDRGLEKEAIARAGVPIAPYMLIDDQQDLIAAGEKIGYPAVLKTCRGGYDGKGQAIITSKKEAQTAYEKLKQRGQLVWEHFIAFTKELSVIVARSTTGETVCFPPAENIHHNNILHKSIVPAGITAETKDTAERIAQKLAVNFQMIGLLAVEMFLTENGEIYVNEIAPRPHNSGHYTIDACETSQFEQHIRSICGWPLGSPELLKPVVMINILGQHLPEVIRKIPSFRQVKLHLYGKQPPKKDRKMGHINILAEDTDKALTLAKQFNIW